MNKRGNPVEQATHRKVLSQQVANPVSSDANSDSGNPAALRVKQNSSKVLSQRVINPSVGKAREGSDVPKGGSTKMPMTKGKY
jgi:hypothetical protein